MNEQELEKEMRAARAQIAFDPERKAALRGHLARIVEADASIRERAGDRGRSRRGLTPQIFFRKLMPIFAGITILALIGGSTSFAAEGTLPGDFLYPVKVGFNEEVRAIAAFTPEAKADWDVRRAERRLEEAEKLTARGAVSENTNAKIAARFDESAERAEAGIAELEAGGDVRKAADIASRLETSIRTHKKILARLSAGKNKSADVSAAAATTGVVESVRPPASPPPKADPPEEKRESFELPQDKRGEPGQGSRIEAVTMATPSSLAPAADVLAAPENKLETKVRLRASAATKIREKLEVQIESERDDKSESAEAKTEIKTAALGKIGAAEKSIESVRNYVLRRRAELGDAAVATAVLRLGAADDLIAQAEARLVAGAFGEAFNLGSQATRITQEARLLVGARAEFKVNFGEDDGRNRSSLRGESENRPSLEKDGKDEEKSSDGFKVPQF